MHNGSDKKEPGFQNPIQLSLCLLELKMEEKSCCDELGIDIESRVAETEPVFDDLSSKSSHDSLSFGDHSSKK